MALRLFPVRARTIVVGLLVCSAATTTFAGTLAAQSRAGGGAGTSRTEPSPRRFTEPPIARRASTSDALTWTSPTDAESLESDIGWLLNSRIRNGTWGAMVVSLSRGDTLYNQNAGEHLLPASTMKLFTAALAFDRLGPGYELSTEILRDGNLRADGTLDGNLIVRGGGDPSLSRRIRGIENPPMSTLAKLIAAAGITRVNGDILGDISAFDGERIPDGWLPRWLEASYAARVSPLSLNENVATVIVTPRARGAEVVLDPPSSTIAIVNNVTIRAKSRGARVVVRPVKDGKLVASGWVGSRSEARYYGVVVDEPARYTVGALQHALEAEGIEVTGEGRIAPAPAGAVSVTRLASAPLGRLITTMNRESNNHYAELLFRDVAHVEAPDARGSVAQANALLRKFLADKAGVNPGDVYAADGSGLSTLDRVTPRALVQLLSYSHLAPWAAAFHSSLPVAGETETLRSRMRATPAAGNLHAKTGTTNEVIALSGFVTARSGELLAFSFLYNGTDRSHARQAIDMAGATLASFAR
jgi:D-alanyl-D-alanine carboxypeptidase/D-alanyl-D-alanine-endopeptidase (penicillin-binding protein 4)